MFLTLPHPFFLPELPAEEPGLPHVGGGVGVCAPAILKVITNLSYGEEFPQKHFSVNRWESSFSIKRYYKTVSFSINSPPLALTPLYRPHQVGDVLGEA